jgi:serine/threonine protein kinase, bacterial
LNNPYGIRFDSLGAMYILDTNNYRVLRWPLGNTFGTVVVNGRGAGSTLDRIGVSYALCLDNQNNIYVSDAGNHRVTKWIAGNNTIGQLVNDSLLFFIHLCLFFFFDL